MKIKKLFIANWKMNHGIAETLKFITQLQRMVLPTEKTEVVLCPPFTSLYTVSVALDGSEVSWGAQNCSEEEKGAFTGEVSAVFLAELACRYVIIGHSERRQHFQESDQLIAKKIERVLQCHMTPVLCVGETERQRSENQTFAILKKQLLEILNSIIKSKPENLVIAYEPIWAIGTGRTATAEQAQEVHAFIRAFLAEKLGHDFSNNVRLVYGGSVHAKNVKSLVNQPDINGVLVGSASLDADSLNEILHQMSD